MKSTYISLEHNGQEKDFTLILYAKDDYTGGNFFDYIKIQLLELTQKDGKNVPAYNENNEPLLYKVEELPGFYDKVGRNTDYIVHAEEVLADNFAYVLMLYPDILLTTPEISQKMIDVMKK